MRDVVHADFFFSAELICAHSLPKNLITALSTLFCPPVLLPGPGTVNSGTSGEAARRKAV